MNEFNSSTWKLVLRQATVITMEVSVLRGTFLNQPHKNLTRTTNTQASLIIMWITNCVGVVKKYNISSHSRSRAS